MRLSSLALAAVVAICPALASAEAPIRIVAAENFYGDLAHQIGGDRVVVTSILSNPDEDPHLFETSPSTAKDLSAAKIVISNGADYDPWMGKLLSATSTKPMTIVAADLIGKKPGDNPHLWYDPKTFPAVAKALADDLSKVDPSHAADYAKRLEAFDASFKTATTDIAPIMDEHKGLEVTATEPVFGYMAQALGFKMLNYPFQVATMNNAEPSPSEVIAFEKSLTDGQAKILFYNAQVTDKTTERLLAIAKAHKVIVVGVTETMPKGVTIQSWFSGQLAEIKKDLAGRTM